MVDVDFRVQIAYTPASSSVFEVVVVPGQNYDVVLYEGQINARSGNPASTTPLTFMLYARNISELSDSEGDGRILAWSQLAKKPGSTTPWNFRGQTNNNLLFGYDPLYSSDPGLPSLGTTAPVAQQRWPSPYLLRATRFHVALQLQGDPTDSFELRLYGRYILMAPT